MSEDAGQTATGIPKWAWIVPVVLALVVLAVEWRGWGQAKPSRSGTRRAKPNPPAPPVSGEITPQPVARETIDPATGAIIDVTETPEPAELPAEPVQVEEVEEVVAEPVTVEASP